MLLPDVERVLELLGRHQLERLLPHGLLRDLVEEVGAAVGRLVLRPEGCAGRGCPGRGGTGGLSRVSAPVSTSSMRWGRSLREPHVPKRIRSDMLTKAEARETSDW